MKTHHTPSIRFLYMLRAGVLVSAMFACTAELGGLPHAGSLVCSDNNPDCQAPPACRVGDNLCKEGFVCRGAEGAMPGSPGACQPECLVGSNDGCPQGHVCISSNEKNVGRCQLPPECYVGDSSCFPWQQCTGYESNADGSPGRCEGTPQCHIGDDSCGSHAHCVGYESGADGSPGSCQAYPPCSVGSPWTCPANTTCVGAPGAQWEAPGTCQPSPRPRSLNNLYMFFGHHSVGRSILAGLNRIQTSLPAELRCRVPIIPFSEQIPSSTLVTQHAGNSFGNPLGSANRVPALVDAEYHLWNGYAMARQMVDAFVEHVRLIMNGRGNIPPQRLDIAFMKFCYVPFQTCTDADTEELFRYYRDRMDRLQEDFPELIIVHFTQATQHCVGNNQAYMQPINRRRMRFRQLILEHYEHTGRVFDLTRFEATDAQGLVRYCNYNGMDGNPVMGLLSEYALSDFGHFNSTAGDIIARELANFLAHVR